MATRTAADVTPSHSIRGYASPLHGIVYNERPHEWLLNDPLDKDAVQYVRHTLLLDTIKHVVKFFKQRYHDLQEWQGCQLWSNCDSPGF